MDEACTSPGYPTTPPTSGNPAVIEGSVGSVFSLIVLICAILALYCYCSLKVHNSVCVPPPAERSSAGTLVVLHRAYIGTAELANGPLYKEN